MISIITVVYNGDRFIESCIKNVIDQKCPNAEHIIIDGCSTDRTVQIIKGCADKYTHIRWISEKDEGQSDAMNKGLGLARGEVVSFLNVDDYYEPNTLNHVLKLFEKHPKPTLLVGNCNIRVTNEQIWFVNKPSKLSLKDLMLGPVINPFPVNPSAYFYHKSIHNKIGFYDMKNHFNMDLDFILGAVKYANTVYVNETFGNFRFITNTKTQQSAQSGEHVIYNKNVYKKHLMGFPVIQRYRLTAMKIFCYWKRGLLFGALKKKIRSCLRLSSFY